MHPLHPDEPLPRRDGTRPPPPAPRDTTAEVARGARAGDEARFTELYERVAPALLAWLHLRLSPAARRRLDAEDVLQEIWLRALRAFPRFDPARGSFRGWIFQVAKYELLDTFRAQAGAAAQAGATAEADGAGLSQVPDGVTSFTRRLARDEDLGRLLDEVQALPAADQALVMHCGLEGRPASEAAVLLGLTHEATRKRWQRLRASLRERARSLDVFADCG